MALERNQVSGLVSWASLGGACSVFSPSGQDFSQLRTRQAEDADPGKWVGWGTKGKLRPKPLVEEKAVLWSLLHLVGGGWGAGGKDLVWGLAFFINQREGDSWDNSLGQGSLVCTIPECSGQEPGLPSIPRDSLHGTKVPGTLLARVSFQTGLGLSCHSCILST